MVTDDTTMSLALGEAILLSGGRVDALLAAQAFDQWMRGKPVDIGNTVRRNLMRFRRTGEPCAPLRTRRRQRRRHAPAAGRAGHLWPGRRHRARGRAGASAGHPPQPLSDAACLTLTGMLHALLAGAEKTVLQQHGAAAGSSNTRCLAFAPRCDNPSGYIVDTLQAVFPGVLTPTRWKTA